MGPLSFFLNVSSKVAGAISPSGTWFCIGGTKFARREFYNPVAIFTLLNYSITFPTIIATAGLGHKNTFSPRFQGLTNHGNHPLSSNKI